MPPIPRFPFTPADLARSRSEMGQQFPGADPLYIEHGTAQEVAINILGPDWYFSRLAGDRPEPFFLRGREAESERLLHQHRVIGLGRDLLVCQYLPGFAERRDELKTRSVAAVYHELRAARLLHDNDHQVTFVTPSGVRGADYDLVVDGVLATEVKAKEDSTAYSRSSLRTTLETARRQLPPDGPGLIVLRVPDSWAGEERFTSEADEVLRGALRSSGRLNGILVLWEVWIPGESGGAACATLFRTYKNESPRTGFDGLGGVLRALSPDTAIKDAKLD